MERVQPVYMKTYGRGKRKVSAWFSPVDRKRAFDSSETTDGSVFEPPKASRARRKQMEVGRCRAMRPAKKKAMKHLADDSSDEANLSDEENVVPRFLPQPVQQSKANRRKAIMCLIELESDESIEESYTSPAKFSPQRKRRKPQPIPVSRFSKRLKSKTVFVTSNSEGETSTKHLEYSAKSETSSNGHPPSTSRFVTRRRNAAVIKPKPTKAETSLFNSSDDFASAPFCSSRNLRFSRKRTMPPMFTASSAENSLNAPGTSSIVTNSLREISLNEWTEQGLKLCSRKPILSSTPSASAFSKRKTSKPISGNQATTPPSISVSCIRDLSQSQEDLASPTHAEEETQNRLLHQEEKSPDLFTQPIRSVSREGSKRKNDVGLSSVSQLSTDSGDTSRFLSATGAAEWLVEALKEKCLTGPCSVSLEKLSGVTQLFSQTTFSSCLEHSSPVLSQQSNNQLKSVNGVQTTDQSSEDSFLLELSMTDNEISGCTPDSKDVRCFAESTERKTASFKTSDYFQCPIAERQSTEQETEKAARLTTLLKEKCKSDKPAVIVKRVAPSQLPKTPQLKDNTSKSLHVSHNNNEDTSSSQVDWKNQGSASSEDNTTSDKEVEKHFSNIASKQKKTSLAPKEKKKRNTSIDRPGTTRKACVSGMSVSRWKTKGNTSKHGVGGRIGLLDGSKAAESTITELLHQQPQGLLDTEGITFSTPVRAGRHNLSALLADLEYNTPTWSRLKAALSVHRKVLVSAKRPSSGSPGREGLADISQDLFADASRTPLSKHLKSLLLSNHSIVVSEEESLSDAHKVYAECGQEQPLAWEECILPVRMKQCVKIGEGTFGEVFSTTNASGETVALKIIPVEGSEKVNGEDQKTLGEILHEIIISKELSSLKDKQRNQTHGFIGLNDLHCVQGCYPPDFLKAWDTFDQRKGSENDRPDFFEKDQLFIILEFEFGGADLENSNGTLSSIVVAKSILHQVTAALAVAEEELHFEHRDLHWGNVLVKTTNQKRGSFLLNGTAHSLETKGVLVRIIDYSLSRLEIDSLTVSCDISNDQELFMGQGDYQFEIYRLMKQENGNNWAEYHPHSNVLWLHYLSSKLLSIKYRCSGGRGIKAMQTALKSFHDNVLQYSSATEVLQNCPMFQ